MIQLDFSRLTPTSRLRGETPEEGFEMRGLLHRALEFVRGFAWCRAVEESFAGLVIPGVIGVFLIRIEAASAEIDTWLWLVVGDLPPAYLVTDDAPTPEAAIAGYVAEMQRWVDAVRAGDSVDDLIPVDVAPTPEHAELLERRLRFLTDEFRSPPAR